jgi:hypothetical protein
MANKLLVYVNQHFGDLVDPRKATAAIIREFKPDEDILYDRRTKVTVKPQKMGETEVIITGTQRDVDDWDEWSFFIDFPEVVSFTFDTIIPPKMVFEGLYRAMKNLASDDRALKNTIPRFMTDKKAMTELAEIPADGVEDTLLDPDSFEYLIEDPDFDKLVSMSNGKVNAPTEAFTVKRRSAKVVGSGDRQSLRIVAVLLMTLDLELDSDDIDPDVPEPDYDAMRKERLEEPDYYHRYSSSLRHASIRIASSLAPGDETRRKILVALQEDEG